MKKVVLATFLACAAIASGLPSALAQADASSAAPAAGGQVQMPAAEYAVYNNAMTQTDPKAKAAAIEAYLTQYPQSAVKADTLVILMDAYRQAGDMVKLLDAADRVLQLDPSNLRALTFEAYIRRSNADAITDPVGKQAAFDAAAAAAQKGLVATKPAGMSDADFKALQVAALPIFYSTIGYAAFNKKDSATAIDAYKKELTIVPPDATKTPGNVLQDIFYMGEAYSQSTPPDYLTCAFYTSRAVAYAPDQYKAQFAPFAKYCYKKYHGADDGYDAVLAAATANLNPPADFSSTVKAAPTPAEQIHTIIASTPDLATLAIADKEMVFQYGSPEDTAKVWETIKGKSSQFPDVLVIASTPTQLQVAVDAGPMQTKTADFTFNMKAPDDLPATATAVQKAAYKKKQDAIAAATAVGQTVTLQGTYDSFTPNPLMITMSDGEVVLAKAAKAPVAKAPVHHVAPKK